MRECLEYKFLKESLELNCNLGDGNGGGGGGGGPVWKFCGAAHFLKIMEGLKNSLCKLQRII